MNVSFYTPGSAPARDARTAMVPAGAQLSTILALADLRHAHILTGEAALDRPITAVVVVDSPTPQGWLRGGELVVTTGSFLKQQGGEWLDALAEANVSGVLILTGKELEIVPQSAIAQAQTLGLQLIALPCASHMPDLLATLARAIDGGVVSHLRHSLLWQHSLLQLTLAGAGFEELARAVAAGIGQPVLIEDRQFNLLAAANPGPSCPAFDEIVSANGTPVAILKRLDERGVTRALRQTKASVYLPKGDVHAVGRHMVPILAGEEVCGFLSVLEATGPLGDEVAAKLPPAAMSLAVEFLKQGSTADSDLKMRRDFFRDLLFANHNLSQETLHRRATYLGYQLSSSYWTLVVEFDTVPSEDALQGELKKLGDTLGSLLSFRQALVITQGQGATVLYPVKDGQPTIDKVRHLAETIRQKVNQTSPGWTVSIGIGQLYPDLMSIPKSYREAAQAAKIGRSLKGVDGVHLFTDLGIYRMLLQFATTQNPNEFFCDALERLLEYDQQADKELVKTLAAFLECNGNLTETSERLFIHRNTLKYRLERIRDITQIDLDDSENRLMLHLGLKMHQILVVQGQSGF
ncbi:MAG: helix-turn-helix domain-containing protein [Candidatus Sericytochromatia bacterium]|nr:helix-turn-helix domain-containing protein [Candidatus Tanganyikabacteria bacterium]